MSNRRNDLPALESTDLTTVAGGKGGALLGKPFAPPYPGENGDNYNHAMTNLHHYLDWRGDNPLLGPMSPWSAF